MGIAYHGNIDKTLTVFICFEWFEEFFLVFLKNNLGKYDTMIEFGKVLTNLFNLQNNGLSCLGFTIENFVYGKKKSFFLSLLTLNFCQKLKFIINNLHKFNKFY